MLKLYKKLGAINWLLVLVILGLTIFQVWCTMELVDYVRGIITSITFLNYHNNVSPEMAAQFTMMIGPNWTWEQVLQAVQYMPEEMAEMKEMITNIANASVSDIWYNGGMMLLVSAASTIAQITIGILAAKISSDLSTNIRNDIYKKVDSFSLAEINKFSTASLITRTTNDVQQVQIANVMMLRMVMAAPVTAIWAILKIQATSYELTIATAVAVVILLIAISAMMFLAIPKFRSMQKLTDRLNTVSRENLTGVRVIRAYNAEEYQENKFDVANNNITKTQLFTGRVMGLMMPIMMLTMNGISLAIYWLGSNLINEGTTDYATVTSFMMLTSQIIMSFMMLMMMFILLPRAQVSATRINEVLETEPTILDPINPIDVKEKGTIEFKNVSFRYPGADGDVVSNISFKANKGETVAIIGATGCGKSTIANMIPRLYDATSGEVLIDGVNVKDLKQDTVHSIVGYVPQKSVLFSGTIKDNISFANPNMDMESITKASEIACASEFIEGMELKYDSPIAQGGKNVSGGQKQRISIARAIANNPEIVVFDDSFSALDFKTDKKVRENLKNELGDLTKVIVAQRIGTIMDADLIICIDNGVAVGMGKHKELLNSCPIYREIALSQLSYEELELEKEVM